MRSSLKAGKSTLILVLVLGAFGLFAPSRGWGFDCSAGEGEPPFLSYGVESNLLLLIDNSASSYDLAYIDKTGSCFDNTYDAATTYTGYFDPATWYTYNFTSQRFEAQADEAAAKAVCSGATGTQFHNNLNYTDDVCLTIDESVTPNQVNAFAAKGDFLNWAAASKFDVQKKILTGGKYDATNQQLVMESRGCSSDRFVKEIPLDNNEVLTLAVKPTSSDDPTTAIEIFQVNSTGFNNQSCQAALDEMTSASPSLGTIKGDIDSCLEYAPNESYESGGIPAFDQAIQTCWYAEKFGWPADGAQHVTSLKNQCQNLYATEPPPTILPSDPGYVCYGQYDGKWDIGYVGRCFESGTTTDTPCPAGHSAGDEWESGSPKNVYMCKGEGDNDGILEYWVCTVNGPNINKCDPNNWSDWQKMVTVTGGANIWTDDDYNGDGTVDSTDVDQCIDDALRDFCGIVQVPQVIDPSDLQQSTGEIWNIPAMLVDSGVVGQLGQPLATMKGDIAQASQPEGLVQQYDTVIRMGAMSFNKEGSKSECSQPNPYVLYNCTDSTNEDGAHLDVPIDSDAPGVTTHQDALVSAINNIKADTWTPLAEAFYDVLGYYGQDSNRRLNPTDFPDPGTGTDPVTNWCQDNHVLVITDGASTADLSPTVQSFVQNHLNDGDGDSTGSCSSDPSNDLSASTMFDDLTYFGWHGNVDASTNTDANAIYVNPMQNGHYKKNIMTHIVTSGTPRNTGSGECNPSTLITDAAQNGGTTLYTSNNAAELESNLKQVMEGVRKGASAGSAASVISSSRGGEGAVYQAIFWPSLSPASGNGAPVAWAGEVHALMVDDQGYLYEDTDGDHQLDPADDKRVIIYFDEGDNETEACYSPLNSDGTCSDKVPLDQVHFLWSADNWLAKVSLSAAYPPYGADDIYRNRSPYISNARQRYIFTWEDLNNDGIVDSDEVLPFVDSDSAKSVTPVNWGTLPVAASRGSVLDDLRVADNSEADSIIDWVRGVDQSGLRSRALTWDIDGDGSDENITWRLGDTIDSTPTVVTRPSEALHLLYKDRGYGDFYNRWQNRRHMIYFGGNDGMLHAINGGFYDAEDHKFWRCDHVDDSSCTESSEPELGAEMWAYVPYNLLPHLKCLTNPDYEHKYYVDQRPRVFDAQIFKQEDACTEYGYTAPGCIHPHGWGTVLVGGMRFGGARVAASSLNGDSSDDRQFTSAYFIMDITNPEAPPTLLAEMTDPSDSSLVDMGYTVSNPTVVTMVDDGDKNDDGVLDDGETTLDRTTSNWYLILGSGPTTIDGESDQVPRLAVVDLRRLVGYDLNGNAVAREPFRIPAAQPTTTNESGSYTLGTDDGFVGDLITVDFDHDPDYMSDAVYFGTVTGSFATSWKGQLYRLVTRKIDTSFTPPQQVVTTPDEWSGLLSSDSLTNPNVLIDAGKPIVAAPAVGTDGTNYWIYFGTGRFFDAQDKSNTDYQGYFGIKEPEEYDAATNENEFTWKTVINSNTATSTVPGNRGVLDVSDIQVSPQANLSCADGTTNCLPVDGSGNTVNTFDALETYMTGKDGWYRQFDLPGERNLGQATLLGGLVTFTTYQPFTDPCEAEGLSYLYGLYYGTGTAWYNEIFSGSTDETTNIVHENISLGRGLAVTPNLHVGSGLPTAFVQTSTGAIKEVVQKNLPIQNFKTGRTSWRLWTPDLTPQP